MVKLRRWALVALASLFILLAGGGFAYQFWRVGEVQGRVTAGGTHLAGAVVRVKATEHQTATDGRGAFALKGFAPAFRVRVTAWASGYYVSGAVAWPWSRTVEIALERHWTTDNPSYAWVPPAILGRSTANEFLVKTALSGAARLSFNRAFLPLASRTKLGCADCHGATVYEQFATGAHAQGTDNARFLTMYQGTDVQGNRSPLTRYATHRDYGRFPLRPDLAQPYYGPGFKLDFPDQPGNCATCHMPGEAASAPQAMDISQIPDAAIRGVHCDFCHKVADVRLNPATGLPYENMPGVLSMELRRPAGEPQIFFGPFDDVDVGPDAFSPLQGESRFCAPCHNASFWGTPVYQSYAEWLASPYPQEGKTCQSCHMKPDGVTNNFAPGRGGQERDPDTIFTHAFPGASDEELLRDTARLEVRASREGDRILVEVAVTNENAGHHIPTDHPMRNILLLVTASDTQGHTLPLSDGPVVPEWGGVGSSPNDYAGRPGTGYAKVLEELWTEVSPTAAYWRQTVVREDTRIPARATDVTRYVFRAAGSGPVIVEARLIFRRAFKELASRKDWDVPDIEMERETAAVP